MNATSWILATATALFSGGVYVEAADPCRIPKGAPGGDVRAFLVLERTIQRRDTSARVLVCIIPATRALRIGGFHGELRWDTTEVAYRGTRRIAGGPQLENPDPPGRLSFAGLASPGVPLRYAVLEARFSLRHRGQSPAISLVMLEVNSDASVPLIARTTVRDLTDSRPRMALDRDEEIERRDDGRGTARAGAAPVLERLEPTEASLDGTDAPLMVTVRGRGFSPDQNVVHFGSIALTNVRSSDGGTVLRFSVPRTRAPGTEAPPAPVMAGEYTVRVTTAAGMSNSITFSLR